MLFFHKTLCFMEKTSRKGSLPTSHRVSAPGYGGTRYDRDRDDWDDFCDRDD